MLVQTAILLGKTYLYWLFSILSSLLPATSYLG